MAALVACSTFASAAIIWDQSPLTLGGVLSGPHANQQGGQNFSDVVAFNNGGTATSMDIWTVAGLGQVAGVSQARIRVYFSNPDGPLVANFIETISIIDTDSSTGDAIRMHADFTIPIILLPNIDYFFSMSGEVPGELGQYGITGGPGTLPANSLNNVRNDSMFQYNETTLNPGSPFRIGDMAFRLNGELNAAPEPASLALLALGLFGLGWSRRNKA